MDLDLLVCARGFASGLAATVDVLATANVVHQQLVGGAAPFRWRLLSSDGGTVETSAGLRLAADGSWDEAEADHRLVFGVGMADREAIGAAVDSAEGRRLVDGLRRAHDDGATLVASCSSTFFLAETGCLDRGLATTSWWLAPLFRRRYPHVRLAVDRLVTEHDRMICAGAAMAQLQLALHLVRRSLGPELAHTVSRYLVIDDQRRSQGPYMLFDHLVSQDEVVARAQAWLRENLKGELRIDALASAVAVSPRTLHRRFTAALGMSPSRYVQQLRAQTAAQLLLATDWSVGRVALEVGYAEDGALRRAFRQHLGVSPRELRRRRRG